MVIKNLKAQEYNPDTIEYKSQKLTYIPKQIAEEFVKDFHRGITQGYNRATALVSRL